MRLPSGSSIASATASRARWTSAGGVGGGGVVAAARSPSAPTSLICWRAAAMAEAMRASLFVVVDGRARGGRGGSGAEDSGGDAHPGGGGGEAGLVLAGGDLS